MPHKNQIDTNIDFFARNLDKTRRLFALMCLFLLILATVPMFFIRVQSGYDVTSIIQAVSVIILAAIFLHVYRNTYTSIAGIVIFIIDIILLSIVTFDEQGQPIIIIYFLTPLLIAYLFFSAKVALICSTMAYLFISFLYYLRFLEPSSPTFQYEIITLIFAGISSIVGLHIVVGLRHGIEKRLIEIAHTDALTELPNRMHFNSRIAQEIERSKREDTYLCLALIDLDYFKEINDSYGHDAGDAALIHVSKLISNSLRSQDILCRFGGDELVLIIPNASMVTASQMLEDLRKEIEKTQVIFNNHTISITVSIGYSLLSAPETTYETLYSIVDKCLYFSKKNGRNQISNKYLAREDNEQ
ncbi:MAG: GGDEF domain-containing protein [Colwellia sp.]|nr:GGDEF domain-containing protein [Colwellia sp.]